jgi:methylation protein EvaC
VLNQVWDIKMIKQCHLCGQPALHELLNLGSQPLANKYPTQDQFASEDFFPLAVYFCCDCKNVQLGTIVSRTRMFEDYYYLSSVNASLVRHFEKLAKKLASAKLVIDVGSNDGILLRPLLELGVKAVGIEPSVNVSKIANDAGLETICAFFDMASAANVERKYGKPDIIVASSVFTHLEDPPQFIEAAKSLLGQNGRLIIEVEYIGNIVRQTQFERFYLDRIFYYSLTSLHHLFKSHGMSIVDVEHIEPHGGSLQVTIEHERDATRPSVNAAALLREEKETLTLEKLKEFRHEVDKQIGSFRKLLEDYKQSNLKVAGYGAPARLSTICNYGQIGPSLIEFTVDDSSLKQNKFTPGTHIPIVPRSHLDTRRPEILVVFAYEYLDDIRNKTRGAYRYVIPIPPREVQ